METAKRTARAIDAAALASLLPEPVRGDLDAITSAVDTVKKSCANVPDASEAMATRLRTAAPLLRAGSVSEVATSLHTLHAAAPKAPEAGDAPAPSPAEQACAKALDVASTVDPARLDPLVREGLSDAALGAIVAPIRAPADHALDVVVRLAAGSSTEADVRALVTELARAVVPADVPVLKDAIAVLPKAVVVKDGAATVDPNAILAFFASEYDVDDRGKPSLRSLLGLKPTPWVFELNGGVPKVDFGSQKVVGDLTFGYATAKLGFYAQGAIDTYDLSDGKASVNQYLHAKGALDAWWLSGDAASALRAEIRVSGGMEYYDTTTYPSAVDLTKFYDFDSRIPRGGLLLGARYRSAEDRVSIQVLVGGGGQYENPDTTTFGALGTNNGQQGNSLNLQQQNTLTAYGNARLNARFRIVPQILGARLRGDATYFNITRAEALTGFGTSTPLANYQEQQLEIHGRLFLDADIASFADFVPALFTGVDVLATQGPGTSTSFVIPVVGAGIVRHSY